MRTKKPQPVIKPIIHNIIPSGGKSTIESINRLYKSDDSNVEFIIDKKEIKFLYDFGHIHRPVLDIGDFVLYDSRKGRRCKVGVIYSHNFFSGRHIYKIAKCPEYSGHSIGYINKKYIKMLVERMPTPILKINV